MQVQPSQISPAEPFDVFYFLKNPVDTTTYYIQAKIYDLRTGEVLATVNLDQSPTNDHLFFKTVQAPPDYASGLGRNIVAIASVYIDSGYTTKSDAYEEQESYFLIKSVFPFVGGGGVDYQVLREMMQEEVAKGLKKLPKPVAPLEVPYEAIFGAIGALQREINRVPKEFDLSAVTTRLDAISEAIAAIPEPKEPDLTPLINAVKTLTAKLDKVPPLKEALESLISEIDALRRDSKLTGAASVAEYQQSLKALTDGILQKVEEALGKQQFSLPISQMLAKGGGGPSPSPMPDVAHLMS